MRMCLVNREVSPYFGAGIGVYVAEMARAYAAAGHDVHLITAPHEGLGDPLAADHLPGVAVHVADPKHRGRTVHDQSVRFARYGFQGHALACHRVLRLLHEREPFDYIEFPEYWADGYFALTDRHATGAFGDAVLGVRLHSPTELVRSLNGEDVLDTPTALLERMELECLRMADVLVSPCHALLGHAQRMLAEADAEAPAGEVVPYPFDLTKAPPDAPVDGGDLPDGEGPLVLYFGRLERRKGVDLLAEAATRLLGRGVAMRLLMVGGDTKSGRFGRSMRADLEAAFGDELGRRVRIEGARPREQLGGLLRAADVIVLPSRWENFPNALLESMAIGGCCIVGSAGGMAEIVQDGVSGAVFPTGESAALERTLESLLADPERRAAYGQAARERVASLCRPRDVVARMESLMGSVRAARPDRIATPIASAVQPRVSVIVPFYNLAHTLPETLESIRAQTFGDYEVLVVDDGSTQPESRAMVDRLEREFDGDRWRVLRKPNGGLGSARNFGIRHARADLVLPLDADDILAPAFLERVVGAMDRDPGLAAVGTLVAFWSESPGEVTGSWLPVGFDRDILCCDNWACNATALLRRDAVLAAGGYDERLTAFEDWDLYCALARRGERCMIVPEFLFHYRIRPGSMLRTEGFSRKVALRSHILARHPGLARRPERALRIELAKSEGYELDQRVRELLDENIRYRLADKVNQALKGVRLQQSVKSLARLAVRPRAARTAADERARAAT
ncbi:MAG: glycosyltransferase [Planctomycetota bacterium]